MPVFSGLTISLMLPSFSLTGHDIPEYYRLSVRSDIISRIGHDY